MAFNFIKGNMQRIFLSANLVDNKIADTSMEFNAKIHQNNSNPLSDPTLYHRLTGSLHFLTMTLLDNSYVVQVAS